MNQLDSTHFLVLPRTHPDVVLPDLAEPLAEIADIAEALYIAHQEAEERIQKNAGLTQEGRLDAITNLEGDTRKRLAEALAPPLGSLKKEREFSESILSGRLLIVPGEMTLQEMSSAEREVRDLLRAMAPEDRFFKYMECCRNGDNLAVRAIENAPASFPLVTAEQVEEGAEAFAAAQHAEEYDRLLQTRVAVSVAETNILRAANRLNPPAPTAADLIEVA